MGEPGHEMNCLAVARATYRRYWRLVTIGLVALVLGQAGSLLVFKIVGLGVDSVRAFGEGLTSGRLNDTFKRWLDDALGLSTPGVTAMEMVGRCLAALAAVALLTSIFQFAKRYCLTGMSRRLEFALRERIYRQIHLVPMDFFARTRSGDIVSRSTADVDAVRMMWGPAVMYLGEMAVTLPAGLALMYSMSPALTLWALIPMGLVTATTLWFSPRERRYSLEVQEKQAALSARAQENFSGVRVVKAYNRESFEHDSFDKLAGGLLDSQLALARNSTLHDAIIWTLNGAGVLIFLYFGAREMTLPDPDARLSLGQFLEFNLYYIVLYWPMIALGWSVMLINRGLAGARRIDEVLAVARDPAVDFDRETDDRGCANISGAIEFRGVSFGYRPDLPVLRDLSFSVAPGRTLAIVGGVGSGKSTLAALLLRLREPDAGAILIDAKPVASYPPSDLRRAIGYVPQETFLFSESIADNIAFGAPGADRAAIERFAAIAGIAEEIREFPAGFDTLLGERGVNLSGGQKQRVAIARALIKHPAIVVLDDCLSAVDAGTEESILAALKRELAGATVIIIAQRVSTVAHADEILVLDEGRVVERGTDRELRARGGLYAALAKRQALEGALTEG